MNDSETFRELIETLEFTIAEQRHLRARGVHLIITHLYHLPGTRCTPGEMVGNIEVGGMAEPISLGLSPRAMLILDCLYRYRMPLTAQRIEGILNAGPFYVNQGANGGVSMALKFDQRSIRVYVERIQERLVPVLGTRKLPINAREVLKCTPTESNQVAYSLHATVECLHVNL